MYSIREFCCDCENWISEPLWLIWKNQGEWIRILVIYRIGGKYILWGRSLKRFSGNKPHILSYFDFWAKNVQFSKFSNPSNQLYAYAMVFSEIIIGGSLMRFSGNKPHILTQFGSKYEANFMTLGLNMYLYSESLFCLHLCAEGTSSRLQLSNSIALWK